MKTALLVHADARPYLPDLDGPFANLHLGKSYAHFCEAGLREDLDVAIGSSASYKDGRCASWRHDGQRWIGDAAVVPDIVYDRSFLDGSFADDAMRADLRRRGLRVLNANPLDRLLKDKLATYLAFPDLLPPTLPSAPTHESVQATIRLLPQRAHPDFNDGMAIAKPRHGQRCDGLQVIHREATPTETYFGEFYVVQPFLETSCGVPEIGVGGRHDIRVVIVDGEIATVEAREVIYGATLRNGARCTPLEPGALPQDFRDLALHIDHDLARWGSRAYSIDMARGMSGRVWAFELNGRPGQWWSVDDTAQIIENRQRQQVAVLKTLARHARVARR